MSDATYYLKYRPQAINELDLETVRDSLNKFVASGKIPHALLFAGPKGTGKTSAARILAKVVNCEKNAKKLKSPCNKCEECRSIIKGSNLDVVELDAASHRGVDEVRAVRDAVKLAPAKARNKVYIIDEAHMLTTEASNALLKTLEEPPEHVYFILATTNPEKLVDTIRSRTTNIPFGKAVTLEVLRSLKRVVNGEKINIVDKSLETIAKHADGSFRDAAKVLEQLVAETRDLGPEKVEEYLFQNKELRVKEIIELIAAKKTKEALEEIERVVSKGGSIKRYVEELIIALRQSLLAKAGVGEDELTGFSNKELLSLIKGLTRAASELPTAFIEQLPLELAIVEWIDIHMGTVGKNVKLAKIQTGKSQEVDNNKQVVKDNPGNPRINEKQSTPKNTTQVSDEIWREILAQVRPKNTSTEALLRAAKPINYDGEILTLGVFYRFHKERLEENLHRSLLENTVATVLGTPVKVVCILAEQTPKIVPEEKKEDIVLTEGEDKDIIKVAKEIFGS